MKKRYNYRAYPSTRQQRELSRLFGCTRFIYNSVIADRQAIYETGLHEFVEPTPGKPGQTRRTFDANRQLALITTERGRKPWLKHVSSVALIQAARDADQAFSNFFASTTGKQKGQKVGFPRFKSRFSGKQSARFTSNGFRVDVGMGRVFVAKIGWIRLAWSRHLPSPPSSVTLTRNADGTYEVSFVVDVVETDIEHPTNRHAGIDLGLADFAIIVYSDGTREKIDNPRHVRAAERRLARAQRSLSRKIGPDRRSRQRASANWKKQQARVARVHTSTRNTRQDFVAKTALRLARENTSIAVEGLNIRGLAKSGGKNAQGRSLRRSIHDVAWGAFLMRLKEKAGDRVISVNPAYTSQTCAVCGVLDGPKPLKIRQWVCHACDAVLDRDYNAALNIMVAAGQVETLNDCGGDVRLQLAGATPGEAGTQWSDEGMVS